MCSLGKTAPAPLRERVRWLLSKKPERNPRYLAAFQQLGESWYITPHVIQQLQQFTCVMYGNNREPSVNHLRLQLLRKEVGEDEHLTLKSAVDLSLLPPCYSALVPHLQRVNHRVALFKCAHVSILEKPEPFEVGQGWTKTEEGTLEPIWSSGPILPGSLVDPHDSTNPDGEQSDDNEDDYFDDFSDSENDD